jgi:hypothetical protein
VPQPTRLARDESRAAHLTKVNAQLNILPMKSPATLAYGMKIRTHATLGDAGRISVSSITIAQRKPDAEGAFRGMVQGHGGGVYLVQHGSTSFLAAYHFDEFDLADPLDETDLNE